MLAIPLMCCTLTHLGMVAASKPNVLYFSLSVLPVNIFRSRAVKHFAPLSKVNNSSIFGRGIRVRLTFLVPVASVIGVTMNWVFCD